jgi:hypothetical protein
MKAVEQFSVPMSDVSVSLGATLQESIDKGDITLDDIKKDGLSFNWIVTRDGKKLMVIVIPTERERLLNLNSNFSLF